MHQIIEADSSLYYSLVWFFSVVFNRSSAGLDRKQYYIDIYSSFCKSNYNRSVTTVSKLFSVTIPKRFLWGCYELTVCLGYFTKGKGL